MSQNINEQLLYVCQAGNFKKAKELLDIGANIEYKDYDGDTPLSISCLYGNIEIVELLLDRGADTNIKTVSGSTH